MTTLVFGQNGQLACELAKAAPGYTFLGRAECDLAVAGAATGAIAQMEPDAIINAAAWTAVDAAEDDEDGANRINRDAVAEIARAAAERSVPFIHISTDYVFDGSGQTPRKPDDPVGPLGAYGRSKLAGEEAIRRVGGTYTILRTAWVFSAHGNNFVKTMLRLSQSHERLTVVADQFGGPTPARDLAIASLEVERQLKRDRSLSGTYHFSGGPDTNWADFAREIFAQAGRNVSVVNIPSADFPTPAARPSNSRLDFSRTAEVFGLERPDWRAGLKDVLADLSQGVQA